MDELSTVMWKMLENISRSHPHLKAECDTRFKNASKDEVNYNGKLRKFSSEFVQYGHSGHADFFFSVFVQMKKKCENPAV